MTTEEEWTSRHYNELIEKYAGKWVLIKDKTVIFADRQFELVYKKSKEVCSSPEECVIRRIDSGDAVFYGTTISNKED